MHDRKDGYSGGEIDKLMWTETMWPMTTSVLTGLPRELLPDMDVLQSLKYPWELLTLLQKTMAKRITETKIGENVTFERPDLTVINGPVWIGEGAKIFSHNKIVGPAYIGKNVVVGDHTNVLNSLVMADNIIGNHVHFARSVLGRGSQTQPGSNGAFHFNRVYDSLFGNEVTLSGGVAISNERLDHGTIFSRHGDAKIDTGLQRFGVIVGDRTVFGANVHIQPGRKVGRNCLVESHVRIYSDIPDRMRVMAPRITNTVVPRS